VDVGGTERLLRAAEIAGVQRIIYLSRLNADPYANFPLLRAKGQAERIVRRSALRWTIVRAAALFGEGDQLTEPIAFMARRSWPLAWLPAGGTVAFQPLWVENLGHILRDVARRYDLDGQTLAVAGAERLHYAEIVRLVLDAGRLTRRPLKIPLLFLRIFALPGRLRRHPPLTPFFIHRFSTPEVLPLDIVRRQFGLQPGRMVDQLGYLRPRGRWR
jgi:NADH dehydrogenase